MTATERKHGRRYPWEDWIRQGRVTLRRGIDYNGRTDTFAQQVRQAASRRYNRSVSIRVGLDGASLTITWGPERGKR